MFQTTSWRSARHAASVFPSALISGGSVSALTSPMARTTSVEGVDVRLVQIALECRLGDVPRLDIDELLDRHTWSTPRRPRPGDVPLHPVSGDLTSAQVGNDW